MPDVVAGLFETPDGILFQYRINTPRRADLWGLPGGRVESGELPDAAIVRELHEELAVTCKAVPGYWCVIPEGLTIQTFFVSSWLGSIVNAEPDRCAALCWCALDDPPAPLTPGTRIVLDMHRGRDAS